MKDDKSPEKRYGPQLANLLNSIAARLLPMNGGPSLHIDCDFTYRTLEAGGKSIDFKVTPDCSPDDRQVLSAVFTQFSLAIQKESSACGVRILCGFDYSRPDAAKPGKGNAHIKTRVTSDALNERLGDGALRPRGTQLAWDAARRLRDALRTITIGRRVS
ncbi:MAG: hypothetical protein A2V88_04875 [Elusimicrobia bacterium RBG_16_66_12]|nr:MAG: hypothetical protein A2V88_04875 [Elusimicrobia bacterium RBG_16_66_12]